jgi:hypothetical protein
VRAVVVVVCLLLAACGSKGNAPMCGRAATLDDGRPGACHGGRTVLACVRPDGFGCLCSTEGTSCPGCAPSTGAVCHDQCRLGEYSVTCGGGGAAAADGAVVVVYDDPPPGCRLIDLGFGLASNYCCPCETDVTSR